MYKSLSIVGALLAPLVLCQTFKVEITKHETPAEYDQIRLQAGGTGKFSLLLRDLIRNISILYGFKQSLMIKHFLTYCYL